MDYVESKDSHASKLQYVVFALDPWIPSNPIAKEGRERSSLHDYNWGPSRSDPLSDPSQMHQMLFSPLGFMLVAY